MTRATEGRCLNVLYQCRTLYNLALEQRITIYKQRKRSISRYGQHAQLPELKEAFPQFKDVSSQVLQNVIDRLDKAYQAFFRRVKNGENPGFPRFKSRDRYDSFTLKQTGWKLEGKYLYLTNIGRLKLRLSRPIEGRIKTITVRRTATGKWFVSFSCDEVAPREFPATNKSVGIDVGIKNFIVDSDGTVIANPKFLKKSQKDLRVKQRTLARRVKGSSGRKKAKLHVAKQHEKIANQRKDFLHKTANYYVRNYQEIVVEDLNIRGLVRNHNLANSITDSSWGMFFEMLRYKAEEAGREVIKIRPNGTSQLCSSCGEKVPKKLSDRIHCCPFCGVVLDRDYNASLNILYKARSEPLGDNVEDVISCVA